MTRQAQHDAAPPTPTHRAAANSRRTTAQCATGMLTLDELLIDPIVRLLMRRDGTDAAAVRRLWEHIAASGPAQTACRAQPLSVVPDELGQLLHETARLWRRRCERAVRARLPCMTCARCAMLLNLEQPGRLNQVTLAHSLDVAPITIGRLLDRLEMAGLVSRLPDPHDRRAYILALTAKARPLIACIHDITRTIQSEASRGLTDIETEQLHVLLSRIRSNLSIGSNGTPSADLAGDSQHA
jgi:MarR family transcriptional regulator, transcriptional regulator for hemolysin